MDELRPQNLDEYVGQSKLKTRLKVHIDAALTRNEPFPHLLLAGPPGSGKTSLAMIVAEALGDKFVSITMPIKDAVLQDHVEMNVGILFMDEIHRAKKTQQESLLSLLEDGFLQTPQGWKVETDWLTIIGATTEPEKIIPPLWDRFTIKQPFEPYTKEEMTTIAKGMASKAEIDLSRKTLSKLSQAAAGVPRNLKQFIVAAQDILTVRGNIPHAHEILEFCRTEQDGLTADHINYLKALHKLGGRAGLDALGMMLRLHKTVVMDLERLLLTHDFIRYGGRGRELTAQGKARILPQGNNGSQRRRNLQKTQPAGNRGN